MASGLSRRATWRCLRCVQSGSGVAALSARRRSPGAIIHTRSRRALMRMSDRCAWFEDANTALHAIRHFLRAPPEAYARNITHAWTHNTRVSINLVCGAGRYVRAVFGKLGTSSKFPLPDEPWLSYSIPHELH